MANDSSCLSASKAASTVRPPKKCAFRNHLNVMVFFSHLPIDALFSKVNKQESAFSGG